MIFTGGTDISTGKNLGDETMNCVSTRSAALATEGTAEDWEVNCTPLTTLLTATLDVGTVKVTADALAAASTKLAAVFDISVPELQSDFIAKKNPKVARIGVQIEITSTVIANTISVPDITKSKVKSNAVAAMANIIKEDATFDFTNEDTIKEVITKTIATAAVSPTYSVDAATLIIDQNTKIDEVIDEGSTDFVSIITEMYERQSSVNQTTQNMEAGFGTLAYSADVVEETIEATKENTTIKDIFQFSELNESNYKIINENSDLKKNITSIGRFSEYADVVNIDGDEYQALKTINEDAFLQFDGKLNITGNFDKLETIGDNAFAYPDFYADDDADEDAGVETGSKSNDSTINMSFTELSVLKTI